MNAAATTIETARLGPAPRQERLALAGRSLAQLQSDALVMWDTVKWTLTARHALPGACGVVAVGDGGLVAVGARGKEVLFLPPGGGPPERFPADVPCPETGLGHLFPDVTSPRHFFALRPGAAGLYRFELKLLAGSLRLTQVLDLPHASEIDPIPARDGGFIFVDSDGVRLDRSSGGLERLPGAVPGPVTRLAPAGGERVWAATFAGELMLVKLGEAAEPVRRLLTPGEVVDLDADAATSRVAVLNVQQAPVGPAQYTVRVYGVSPEPMAEVPAGHGAPPAQPLDDLQLGPTWVAAAGPERLAVWDLKTRASLLTSP